MRQHKTWWTVEYTSHPFPLGREDRQEKIVGFTDRSIDGFERDAATVLQRYRDETAANPYISDVAFTRSILTGLFIEIAREGETRAASVILHHLQSANVIAAASLVIR